MLVLRARLIAVISSSLVAILTPLAGHAQSEPFLPPPAPESSITPVPGIPPGGGPGLAPQDATDEHDVLTRGPIHEAFAEQYNADPVEGLIVPKAPPEPIDEVPPETMPEGNNIQWIPGYPAWDDERQDFIWISGLWRDVPPNQRWVPGYWDEVPDGFQWVAGFWTAAETTELDYLPQPPESLEQGPNIAAPSDDQFWVPGVWNYVDDSYRWRPGYWAPAYDDWVWVPDRYVWTPYGYVFCSGYYDYRLPVRAVAFAPVYFSHYSWWHYHPYTPSVVLDVGPLTMHWFVRPNYCHYYFGDYYANTYYSGWGLQPWYTCSFGFGGYGGWRGRPCYYDPLLVFYSGYHRRHHGIDFRNRMHRWHDHYRDHADDRPRWTAREQDHYLDELKKMNRQNARYQKLGRSLEDVAANPTEPDQKFVKLDRGQRDRHTKVAKETVQLATLRHDAESDGGKHHRGDGRRGNKPGETIVLPQATTGVANSDGGSQDNDKNSRRSRKLKLPENQGAGDQTVVNETGSGGGSNRRSRKTKTPEGPPGGVQALTNGGNSGDGVNNSSSRGRRSRALSNDNSGAGNNDNGQNSNRKGDRRGSQNNPLTFDPVPTTGNGSPNTGDGGSGSSKGSSRSRSRGNVGNQNPGQPFGGNAPAPTGNDNSSKNRNPRRGNSGSNNNGGGNFQFQQQGGNPNGGGSGGNSDPGGSRSRSRNRGNSGFQSNGGGSSGNFQNFGNSGNSNNGNSNKGSSRRNSSSKSSSSRQGSSGGNFQVFGNSGSGGGSFNNNGNSNSGRSRESGGSSGGSFKQGRSSSGNQGSFNSGGGSRNRNSSGSSSGGGGSGRKSKKSGN